MHIGVLGGGQLGRMLALAGYPLGHRFRFFDTIADACAGQLAELMVGDYADFDALTRFSEGLDVVTFEFENVPVASARFLAQRLPVYPPPEALEAAQDRLNERSLFERLQIASPRWSAVDSKPELERAVANIGIPSVLKTRRLGYDGKGQFVLREPTDLDRAWEVLTGVPLILEEYVPFNRELSILSVRSQAGDIAFYPLVENHHREGILRVSIAPAPHLTPEYQEQAQECATKILQALDYVGVLAIELFEHEGRLLANEIAPRVHNSGHWTIEGAEASQFENHLRAITGQPLGSTKPISHSFMMINLIGAIPKDHSVLEVRGAHLHLYGKEPRPGRKVGHVTMTSSDQHALKSSFDLLQARLSEG